MSRNMGREREKFGKGWEGAGRDLGMGRGGRSLEKDGKGLERIWEREKKLGKGAGRSWDGFGSGAGRQRENVWNKGGKKPGGIWEREKNLEKRAGRSWERWDRGALGRTLIPALSPGIPIP